MQKMRDPMNQPLSLFFRDVNFKENTGFPHEYNEFCRDEMEPSIVAAISGALLACGLLGDSSVITAIKPLAVSKAWKKAGIMDLMAGRDLFSNGVY